jgi:hypothetical protein
MNTNENTNTSVDAREEVVDLGIASVETKGTLGGANEGVFHTIMPGISEE